MAKLQYRTVRLKTFLYCFAPHFPAHKPCLHSASKNTGTPHSTTHTKHLYHGAITWGKRTYRSPPTPEFSSSATPSDQKVMTPWSTYCTIVFLPTHVRFKTLRYTPRWSSKSRFIKHLTSQFTTPRVENVECGSVTRFRQCSSASAARNGSTRHRHVPCRRSLRQTSKRLLQVAFNEPCTAIGPTCRGQSEFAKAVLPFRWRATATGRNRGARPAAVCTVE